MGGDGQSTLDDVARFGPSEDEEVVRASLACPYCLCQPAHVLIVPRSDGGEAICACGRCRQQWSVALDPDQALRLALAPPRDLWVQHQRAGGDPEER